jgi:hypothetical protein
MTENQLQEVNIIEEEKEEGGQTTIQNYLFEYVVTKNL